MRLKFVIITNPLHCCITSRFGESQLHRLLEQFETLHFINCLLGRLGAVKDYESLALCLQIGLGDDIHDFAILGEELCESFLQLVDFNTLLKVADIHTGKYVSGGTHVSMCNDTYVAQGGGLMEAI
jgi:hypothetical protein